MIDYKQAKITARKLITDNEKFDLYPLEFENMAEALLELESLLAKRDKEVEIMLLTLAKEHEND